MTKPSIKLLALLLMAGTAVGQTGLKFNTAPPVDVTVAVEIKSHTGTVVKLSDDEFARLQKLRQAVVDAETEIAKAHGVYLAPFHCFIESVTCPHPESRSYLSTCDRTDGCPEKPSDRYQFRGQFLLINVPKESLHEPK